MKKIILSLVLFLHGTSAVYSVSKESAVARCEANVKLLTNASRQFKEQEIDAFFPKFLACLQDILEKLKNAKEPQDIVTQRKACDTGFSAARFLVETFENNEVQSGRKNTLEVESPHAHSHTHTTKNTLKVESPHAHSHTHTAKNTLEVESPHAHSHTHTASVSVQTSPSKQTAAPSQKSK